MKICPHCSARLASNAIFCRECGSDENTGWSEDATIAGYLPEEEPGEEDAQNIFGQDFLSEKTKFSPVLAILAILVLFTMYILPYLRP